MGSESIFFCSTRGAARALFCLCLLGCFVVLCIVGRSMKRNVFALEVSAKEDAIERLSQVYGVEEIVAGRLFEVTPTLVGRFFLPYR